MPTNNSYPTNRPNYAGINMFTPAGVPAGGSGVAGITSVPMPPPMQSMNPLTWHTPVAQQQMTRAETHANARRPTLDLAKIFTSQTSHGERHFHAGAVFGNMAQRPWSTATPAIFDAAKNATPKTP